MQHSITIHGAKAKDTTGLKRIPSTPEGIAFGNVPGKVAYHDPDYADASLGWARERVDNTKSPFDGVITELANGQKMFGSEDEAHSTRIDFEANVNPERWSVVTVLKPRDRDLGPGPGVTLEYDGALAESGEIAIVLGFTREGLNNFFLYEDGRLGETRLTYAANFADRTTPAIMTTTFSIDRGIRIYDGGELVASNPDDKRPLTQHDGAYSLFRNGRGQFGANFLLNTDLSDPENTGFKRAIEKFLMTKYDIPEGPQ